MHFLNKYSPYILSCSSRDSAMRESFLAAFKEILIELAPADYLQPPRWPRYFPPAGMPC
ncbi:MAG: hypothetical protein U5P10_08505 [Spirochaetia bacterium]|nr:hypothetical protein [Spirochaetia bacterium]